ncbi:MAG: hypothetical protein ABIW76_03735 [Fibrobacteria bacterium]
MGEVSGESRMLSATVISAAVGSGHGVIAIVKVNSENPRKYNGKKTFEYGIEDLEMLFGTGYVRDRLQNPEPVFKAGREYIMCFQLSLFDPKTDAVEIPANGKEAFVQKHRELIAAAHAHHASDMRASNQGPGKGGENGEPEGKYEEWEKGHQEVARPPILFSVLEERADFAFVKVLAMGVSHAGSGSNVTRTEYSVTVLESILGRKTWPRRLHHNGGPVFRVGRVYLCAISKHGDVDIESGSIPVLENDRAELSKKYHDRVQEVLRVHQSGGDIYQVGSAPRILSDSQIAETFANKECRLVWVKVLSVREESKDTRGWNSSYDVNILETLAGSPIANGQISHWGGPTLKKGKEYILGLFNLDVRSPGPGTVQVPENGREEFVQKHRMAVRRLNPDKTVPKKP